MSTSLAVQPAYRATLLERTRANPNRTIFGTTLDDYQKCWTLLNDPKTLQEATDWYNKKSKWKPRSPTLQRIIDIAWGLRDYTKPKVGEETIQNFKKLPAFRPIPICHLNQRESADEVELDPITETNKLLKRSLTKSSFRRNSGSVCSRRSAASAISNISNSPVPAPRYLHNSSPKQRPMSEPVRGRRTSGGEVKVRVPKFRLPAGTTNFMQTASMKITETGAKDLLRSKPINKVGLGDTLQYNYQAFQRQQTPKFYESNGHVLLLGQKFTGKTTNMDESAPGGFYNSDSPDRYINETFRYVKDRSSEVTMTHRKAKSKRSQNTKKMSFSSDSKQNKAENSEEGVSYEIPLNILHKFGEENVTKVLQENKDELLEALQKPSELTHSALVPPRLNVKELNHPIDPPPTYFTTFGENLKYDKFEGGLHLYIK